MINDLNINLKEKIKQKYENKIKKKIINKYSKNYYTLEILEANVIFYKNKYKTVIDEMRNELKDYLKNTFKKEINSMIEYKIERNKIFRMDLVKKLLNNLSVYELDELYEYVKDKKIIL